MKIIVAESEESINERNEKIMSMLRDNKTSAEIAKEVGISRARAATIIKKLKIALEA